MRLRDLSVRRKVTLISMATSICVLLLTTVIFAVYDLMMYRRKMVATTTAVAQVVGNNSKAAIVFNDPETANRTLSALRDIPQILCACILDRSGRVFSLYARGDIAMTRMPQVRKREGFVLHDGDLCVFTPVYVDDEWIGTVYIRHSMVQFYRHVFRIVAIAAAVLVLALLAGWVLSMRLQQLVSGPLLDLAETARQISKDRDFSRRARQHSNDEIGFLVKRINSMLDEIQKQDAELREKAVLLENNQSQLRSLASELLLTEERERRHLATDLHDTVCQTLAIAKLKLDCMAQPAPDVDRVAEFGQIAGLITNAIEQTRSALFQLSPQVLYEVGLEAAIEDLAERVQSVFRLQVTITDDGESKPLDDDLRVLVFRCIQELIMNVVKHAKASKAVVSLALVDGALQASVSDDGVGLIHSQRNRKSGTYGYGLFSIRERVHHFGGEISIRSNPGKGTRVTLRLPLSGLRTERAVAGARNNGTAAEQVPQAMERRIDTVQCVEPSDDPPAQKHSL
jgi:signal transduction histidine kinase